MRLWSLHPRYLDTAGLTAGWREALLAQKVLTGTTRGYRNHPQLERFRAGSALAGEAAGAVGRLGDVAWPWPGDRVVAFLHDLADEAAARGYAYDRSRIMGSRPAVERVPVTDGQVAYEWAFLRAKLAVRSPDVLARWADVAVADVHPLFTVVPGPVAPWEKVTRPVPAPPPK